MKLVTRNDISIEEFKGAEWFFQLMVWLDFLVHPIPHTIIETGTLHGHGAVRFATFFANGSYR